MRKNIFNKSDLTKQYIIEKSAPTFNKKGITGTSLSDITRATGLTKGSIYGNFKDKDEVAISVFKYNLNNFLNFLTREINQGETAIEKLTAIPAAYKKLYKHMIEFGGCPILNTATEADDTHHALCKLTREAIAFLKKNIVHLIASGQQAGEIKHDANADKLSEVVISLIEGGCFLSKATGEKSFLMNSLDLIEQLIGQLAALE